MTNEKLETAIEEHLLKKLEEDLTPDQITQLRTKVNTIRELAAE
jgi:hypothetical protein